MSLDALRALSAFVAGHYYISPRTSALILSHSAFMTARAAMMPLQRDARRKGKSRTKRLAQGGRVSSRTRKGSCSRGQLNNFN